MTEKREYVISARSLHAAVLAALKASAPGAMIDMPLLLKALAGDYTDRRNVAAISEVKEVYRLRVGENFLGSRQPPWPAEQALSRVQCINDYDFNTSNTGLGKLVLVDEKDEDRCFNCGTLRSVGCKCTMDQEFQAHFC